MEKLVSMNNIAAVIGKLRPAAQLSRLQPIYDIFERLLGELLLLGSTDPDTDIEQFLRELEVPAIQACARTYVYEEELGRMLATVAYYGPQPIDPDVVGQLWPIRGQAQSEAVAEMVRYIQAALIVMALAPAGGGLRRLLLDTGKGWPVSDGYQAPPRGRGRPRDLIQKSVLVLGAREGIFPDGARRYVDVIPAIATVYEGKLTPESIARRLKVVRHGMPIPKEWQKTLLCDRVSPLRSGLFNAPADALGAPPPLVVNWKAGLWPKSPR